MAHNSTNSSHEGASGGNVWSSGSRGTETKQNKKSFVIFFFFQGGGRGGYSRQDSNNEENGFRGR